MKRCLNVAIATLSLLLWSVPALAQNQVVNGNFDTTLSGWIVETGDGRSAVWVADDALADPASGSVEIRHSGAADGFPVWVLSQCVSVAGQPVGQTDFGLHSKALVEGEDIVQAWASLTFYRDLSCNDFDWTGPTLALAINNANWSGTQDTFNLLASTASTLIELGIARNAGAGPGGAVRFDGFYIGEPGGGPSPVALDRWSIDAGGGRVSGGNHVLSGSIGQPDVGLASAGAVRLQAGFWFDSSEPPPLVDVIFRDRFRSP